MGPIQDFYVRDCFVREKFVSPLSIIIDHSRVMLQIVVSLTKDPRGIIYDHNMFIVEVTGVP